ncbi:MAG: anthranilate synthase component I [Actinomycetia bacterium]|nr:anthranilate synthase component I [Actinomycetes bacterium]
MTSGGITTTPSREEARGLSARYNVIPIAHRFVDDTETPVSAFLKLRQAAGCFLLESAEQGLRLGRYSFLGVKAWESVRLTGGAVTIRRGGVDTVQDLASHGGDPFAFMAQHMSRYRGPALEGLPPFVGGAVGYFGYDCIRHVERLPVGPPDDLGLPDMAFLLTDVIMVFDHLAHTITLLTNIFCDDEPDLDAAYAAAATRLAEVKARLRAPIPPPKWSLDGRREARGRPPAGGGLDVMATPVRSNFEREKFLAAVERIREYIRAGDAFQVVLSQRFERPVDVSGFSIYRGLRAVNPSPYMYYLAFRDFELVGSSPEPLVTVGGGRAETRPIAGTRPRGATPAEDAGLAEEMLRDEKERAEHLMLVDLGRNDLGRVCRPGTVKTQEFMEVERYSHVMHMVSSVVGDLEDGVGATDALRAVFPAGTVSGAPKVRAMEIIDELEPNRRGPYAGAIGYLSYSGDLDCCIYIRTILVREGHAYVQAGAGIVADSEPEREFAETENKARAMFRAIELATAQEEWE